MPDIDLSGMGSTLKTSFDVDEDQQIVTVSFKDELDVVIGSLILDMERVRSTMEVLAEVLREVLPSEVTHQGHRTKLDRNTDEAETEFHS